jgi:molybdopterin converting factor small subunit
MQFRIRLFAGARDAAGRDFVEVDLADAATAGDAKRAIAESSAALEPWTQASRLAVDGGYVRDSHPLRRDSEIALIPPVSGG